MTGRGDDRGVSEVIGFILVFAFLVLAFTIYQGIAVPDQNRDAEFDHNQRVQGDVQELRNAILSAARGGSERTVAVKLDAEYPRRTLALNLGFAGGTLRTETESDAPGITIANATSNDRYGETADFWNGTAVHSYPNRELVYEPMYSYYTNAPETVYANTLAYNRFGDDVNLSITGQALVDDNRLALVSLVGNLSESGTGTVSVDPDAVSASNNRISIRNETDPVNVTIRSHLDAAWWNDTLSEERVEEGGHVSDVRDVGNDRVAILLEPGVTYSLRMAQISVGPHTDTGSTRYLTLNERPSRTVFNDTSHSITVEVRDRFNNPVNGVEVNASEEWMDGRFSERTIETGVGGLATFNYTAPSEASSDDLYFNVTSEGDGHPDHEEVWVNLSVKSTGSGGGGTDDGSGSDQINPNTTDSVYLETAEKVGGGSSDERVDLTLRNNGSSDREIDRMRVMFYYDGDGSIDRVVDVTNRASGQRMTDDVYPRGIPTGFVKVNEPEGDVPRNGEITIRLEFNDGVATGDFFYFSVEFADGRVGTYIAAPS